MSEQSQAEARQARDTDAMNAQVYKLDKAGQRRWYADHPLSHYDAEASDMRKLYDWLGVQVRSSRQEAAENELAVNLDASVGPGYAADAMVEVRRHMRHMDPSLTSDKRIDRS